MKQLIKLFSIFLAISLLPACGPHYRKRSLTHLQQGPADYKKTINNITLEVKKLDKNRTNSLFDGQGKHLNQLQIQPLYFKITNDSNNTFMLNSSHINLIAVNQEVINNLLAKNYWPIAGAFGKALIPLAGSFLLLKAFTLSTHPLLLILSIPTLTVCAALIVFGTPVSIGYGCYSSYQAKNQVNEYNENLAEDISEKTIQDSLKIPADTTQEFIFFADAKQFKNNFDITLTEKITQKPLTFNVTL